MRWSDLTGIGDIPFHVEALPRITLDPEGNKAALSRDRACGIRFTACESKGARRLFHSVMTLFRTDTSNCGRWEPGRATEAALVFASLLVGYPDHFGQMLLGEAQHNTTFTDPSGDIVDHPDGGPCSHPFCHALPIRADWLR